MTTALLGGIATSRRMVGAAVVALVALMAVLMALPAVAQDEPVDVEVRTADVTQDGVTRVLVDVQGVPPGDIGIDGFEVREDGEVVEGLELALASDAEEQDPSSVVIALDTSGSTAGPPIEAAIAAAKEFATTVGGGNVQVGLVTFSTEAELVVEPTNDPAAITTALDDVVADGGTALYDAVIVAARAIQELPGQRSIVVFSDGADGDSTTDLSGAARAAQVVGAEVTSVALQTEAFDLGPLNALAGSTNGRLVQVESVDQLQGAFATVAQDLASQYVLTYPNTGRTGQFDVQVTITALGANAADSIPVLNTFAESTIAPPTVNEVTPPGTLQQPWVKTAAVAAAGVGLLLLFLVLIVPRGDRAATRNLRAAVGDGDHDDDGNDDLSTTTAALSMRAIRLVERVPKPDGYDEAYQLKLDQAGWPMRASEFTAVRAIVAVVGAGLAWALTSTILLGVAGGVVGWFLPGLALGNTVQRRQNKFMNQLPDTLQLISGSLKAGYGVLQAIDTVVKESPEPTSTEFQRVLTEARLGMPLEDSLTNMADRIGTEDFRWVAVAINIQRRVGGNLAKLLETVGHTLRERSATRRQIKALSAEGRLSAVVLTALPITLGLYMWLVNPEYLGVLFTDPRGQALSVFGVFMMGIGIFWMKNLIEIDV